MLVIALSSSLVVSTRSVFSDFCTLNSKVLIPNFGVFSNFYKFNGLTGLTLTGDFGLGESNGSSSEGPS